MESDLLLLLFDSFSCIANVSSGIIGCMRLVVNGSLGAATDGSVCIGPATHDFPYLSLQNTLLRQRFNIHAHTEGLYYKIAT